MHVQVNNNFATATDGHILVRIDLKLHSDFTEDDLSLLNGKLIHKDIWASITKSHLVLVEEDGIIYHKKGIKFKAFYNLDAADMKYPDYSSVINPYKTLNKAGIKQVGISAKKMQLAQKALGEDSLFASLYEKDKAIIIHTNEDGKMCLFMPLTTEDSAFDKPVL